jgi:hypothetical protein
LLLAADFLGRPQLRHEAESAALRACERFEASRMPWPCGVPSAGETPNLLLGLAGIGYFLLRLYNSREVPTVLLPAANASNLLPDGRIMEIRRIPTVTQILTDDVAPPRNGTVIGVPGGTADRWTDNPVMNSIAQIPVGVVPALRMLKLLYSVIGLSGNNG